MSDTYTLKEQFSQYLVSPSLVIIAGVQEATLWELRDGTMRQLQVIAVDNPEYSDREGFFTRSGKGEQYGSGSVYEDNKEYTHTKFLRELQEFLQKEAADDYEMVYWAAPAHVRNDLEETIPARLQKLESHYSEGNFHNQHPFEFLQMIVDDSKRKEKEKKLEQASGEAKKLLERD